MPDKQILKRVAKDKREGKSPSTQTGEFIREEMHHIREGKHSAHSIKQAIAIGLSQVRRSCIELPLPRNGKVTDATRRKAERDQKTGHGAQPKRHSVKQ